MERSVQTPTLDIGYVESGDASGVPIVLLHGFPDDVHAYDGVAPPLAARRLVPVGAVALAVPLISSVVAVVVRPTPVALANPCVSRSLPNTGGITGVAQDVALRGLDVAACGFGSTREELVLALANDDDARRYEAEYGVNPRSPASVVSNLLHQVPNPGSLKSTLEQLVL